MHLSDCFRYSYRSSVYCWLLSTEDSIIKKENLTTRNLKKYHDASLWLFPLLILIIFQKKRVSRMTMFPRSFYQGTSIHHVMAAILLTTGPICTYTSFVNTGPKHLRKIKKEMYDQAAQNLHEASVGQFMTISSLSAGLKEVFIKRTPNNELREFLEQLNLCSMEEYTTRFHLHLPRRITRSYREKLVELGYLTLEQIKKPSAAS